MAVERITLQIRLEKELRDDWNLLCNYQSKNGSEVIRKMIKDYIDNNKDDLEKAKQNKE